MRIRFQVWTNSCAASPMSGAGSRASSLPDAPSVAELKRSRPPHAPTWRQYRSSYSGCAAIATWKVSGTFRTRIATSNCERSAGSTRNV